MDPNVYCKDSEKTVYEVHLETAIMIQLQLFILNQMFKVAGSNGRIVISDFWDFDGYDVFQLESYVHQDRQKPCSRKLT